MEKEFNTLKEMLEEEIRKITKKGDITPTELDNATKAVCLIEKIKELDGMSAGMDEYSERNYSFARGRSPVTGRYISRGMDARHSESSYDGRRGYSGHSINDKMVAKLEEMYDEAKTEHERDVVDMWIRQLETER